MQPILLALSRSHVPLHTRLPSQPARLQPPCHLVRPIQLRLNSTPDAHRRHRRPHAPLAPQNPIVQRISRGCLQQPNEIPRCDLRHQHHARTGDALVDQEPSNSCGKEAEGVKLAEAVAHFEPDHAYQEGSDGGGGTARFEEGWAVHVGLEEGNEVGTGLGDDEVIDVEELCDAHEGRVAVGVGGVGPVAEVDFAGGGPGDDVAVLVFAEDGVFA